jgi:hypothetical protein
MEKFDPERVAAEIRDAFDRYEAALMGNDVDALIGFFWNDQRAVRLMTEGGQYGTEEIAAFRRSRDVSDVTRELLRAEIVVLSDDFGVAAAEYGAPARAGAALSRSSGCGPARVGASQPPT